jgi:gamma-glutamylcyclotransferase (GGCT)/AIG2-like uncharacterized protein YtfP
MIPVELAVNGTLMRGLELNRNMIDAGATFVREAATVPAYRIWSINDRHPAMFRVASGGVSVAVEVWAVSPEGLAQILIQEPSGLCIGKVRLTDGEELLGVLGEPLLCEGQREITQHGGWRAYIASKNSGWQPVPVPRPADTHPARGSAHHAATGFVVMNTGRVLSAPCPSSNHLGAKSRTPVCFALFAPTSAGGFRPGGRASR